MVQRGGTELAGLVWRLWGCCCSSTGFKIELKGGLLESTEDSQQSIEAEVHGLSVDRLQYPGSSGIVGKLRSHSSHIGHRCFET